MVSLCTVYVSQPTFWKDYYDNAYFWDCESLKIVCKTTQKEMKLTKQKNLCCVRFFLPLVSGLVHTLCNTTEHIKTRVEEGKSQSFFSGIYKIIKVLNAFKNYRMKLTAYKNMKWFFCFTFCRQAGNGSLSLLFPLVGDSQKKSFHEIITNSGIYVFYSFILLASFDICGTITRQETDCFYWFWELHVGLGLARHRYGILLRKLYIFCFKVLNRFFEGF